jgi:hypothetical protein
MLSLVTTAFGHLLFAVAITRSKTLFLPIGIHLGNNWAQRNLFSFQEMGTAVNTAPAKDSLFRIKTSATEFSTFHTVGSYLITFACFFDLYRDSNTPVQKKTRIRHLSAGHYFEGLRTPVLKNAVKSRVFSLPRPSERGWMNQQTLRDFQS